NARGSCPTPFLPQLRPILQPFPDLAFEPALGWVIKLLPFQRFRKIVLPGKGLFGVMVVGIAATIAHFLHQPGRRIEHLFWRQQGSSVLRRTHGSTESGITCV